MVTEERSFPPKGSPIGINGYRRKEFSVQRVIKVPQWLPRKGVFRPKGHQPPTMVTEERSFPVKGSPKSLNSYRRKEFPPKRVTNRPQWLPKKGFFRPKGHKCPSKVTENTNFPQKWSPTALNSYRILHFPLDLFCLSVAVIFYGLQISTHPYVDHHGNVAELLCHYLFCLPINFTVYICQCFGRSI